ncbi:MAG: two-component regulator propeller domain-containing protein [Bacteroidales bacterium]
MLLQQYTTTNSPLSSNGIYKLVPDAQGNLWIATGG